MSHSFELPVRFDGWSGLLCGLVLCLLVLVACEGYPQSSTKEDSLSRLRNRMVSDQLERRGIKNPAVLAVMRKIPRHLFVPPNLLYHAYDDTPLPIDANQTISQPYIVALMTELIKPQPDHKVLEIGTGSGYQAAVLAELVKEVYTIEIIEELGKKADGLLQSMQYKNIWVKIGDGYQGWAEHAPYDGIVVTAAPPDVPKPLLEQLKIGGRLVIPIGRMYQELILVTKDEKGIHQEEVIPVRFVPMTGEVQKK